MLVCAAKHKDMLVTTTENAILNEVNLFYQQGDDELSGNDQESQESLDD